MKILVKNFQAIETAKVDVEGLTVVTGRSNLGKSCLVRAINSALFGNPGDTYVKWGTDQCAIGIGSNEFTLKWWKVRTGKASPTRETALEINGKRHTKLGREHTTLTEPLGMKELRTGDVRLRPQVALQLDQIFLLGETEATAAEVFKLLGRTDTVTEAQRRVRYDLKKTDGRIETRSVDIRDLEGLILGMEEVPKQREKFKELQRKMSRLTRETEKRETSRSKLHHLTSVQPKSIPIQPKPERPVQLEARRKLRELKEKVPRKIPPQVNLDPIAGVLRSYLHLKTWKTTQAALDLIMEERIEMEREEQRSRNRKLELEKILKMCPTCGGSF